MKRAGERTEEEGGEGGGGGGGGVLAATARGRPRFSRLVRARGVKVSSIVAWFVE